MPSCRECGVSFPSRLMISGKLHVVSNRTRCLKCSPFKSFHGGLNMNMSRNNDSQWCCPKHPQSSVAIRADGARRCRQCTVDSVTNKRYKNLTILVELAGGKCVICGYNKCKSAMDFHHVDPLTKEFGIASWLSLSFKRLKAEAQKCVLLCKNCHAEVEAGVTILDSRSTVAQR